MQKLLFDWNIRNDADLKTAIRNVWNDFNHELNSDLYYSLKLFVRRKKRTITQNSLYWIFCTFVANNHAQFNNKNEVHYLFRANFLQRENNEKNLNLLNAGASMVIMSNALNFNYTAQLPLIIDFFSYNTKELNSVMFGKYLKEIANFCSDNLDLRLVFPDDDNWQDFFNEYNKS